MDKTPYWFYTAFLSKRKNNNSLVMLKQLRSPLLKPIYGEKYRIYLADNDYIDLKLNSLDEIEIYGQRA